MSPSTPASWAPPDGERRIVEALPSSCPCFIAVNACVAGIATATNAAAWGADGVGPVHHLAVNACVAGTAASTSAASSGRSLRRTGSGIAFNACVVVTPASCSSPPPPRGGAGVVGAARHRLRRAVCAMRSTGSSARSPNLQGVPAVPHVAFRQSSSLSSTATAWVTPPPP
jgi:hypothetical protein